MLIRSGADNVVDVSQIGTDSISDDAIWRSGLVLVAQQRGLNCDYRAKLSRPRRSCCSGSIQVDQVDIAAINIDQSGSFSVISLDGGLLPPVSPR
jgi:hypothetical protein